MPIPTRKYERIEIVVILTSLLIFIAYIALTPIGHWQTDEYSIAQLIHQSGLHGLLQRLLHWSPRPLSELFIFSYFKLVDLTGLQIIGWILSLFWLILLACSILPIIMHSLTKKDIPSYLVISLSLCCMFLLNHPVAEFFYWPVSSLAYMPTLSAITLVYGASEYLNEDLHSTSILISVSLIVAALCTEVGAMFTAMYCFFGLLLFFFHRESDRRPKLLFCGLVTAFIVSIGILYSVIVGRVQQDSEIFGEIKYVHHILPSLISAIPHSIWAYLSSDDLNVDFKHLALGLVIKLLFFFGVFYVARSTTKNSLKLNHRLPLIGAALLIVPLTLFAAYYQFGTMACCERQNTFRQCLIFVSLASLANLAAVLVPRYAMLQKFLSIKISGNKLLLSVLVVAFVASFGKIRHDYENYVRYLAAHSQTWASGRSSGESMVVTQAPYGKIVGGYSIVDAKTFRRTASTPAPVLLLMNYFDKTEITFKPVDGK